MHFLEDSKFGCPECVHTFGFLLDDYFKKYREAVSIAVRSIMEEKRFSFPYGGGHR